MPMPTVTPYLACLLPDSPPITASKVQDSEVPPQLNFARRTHLCIEQLRALGGTDDAYSAAALCLCRALSKENLPNKRLTAVWSWPAIPVWK